VLLEELPRRRLLVDVDFLDLDAGRGQSTSGVFTGGSGGLPVEGRFGHDGRIMEIADFRFQISDWIGGLDSDDLKSDNQSEL
jgi:hypothetical protein